MEEVEILNENSDSEVDIAWINNFEKEDLIYRDFYKEKVQDIKVLLFYIDKNNSITSGKKLLMPLKNGILEKQTLIKILNENMNYNSKKYRPISLLKWNINLEPDSLIDYLKDTTGDLENDFITIEDEINDIKFDDTINILQDLNTFYILFHESWKSYHNRSKKIYIKNKLKRNNNTKRLKNT
tara:strand:- start:1190 stop:1738 length:549 start_codon:yes stop_codon:yes gene_type:complete